MKAYLMVLTIAITGMLVWAGASESPMEADARRMAERQAASIPGHPLADSIDAISRQAQLLSTQVQIANWVSAFEERISDESSSSGLSTLVDLRDFGNGITQLGDVAGLEESLIRARDGGSASEDVHFLAAYVESDFGQPDYARSFATSRGNAQTMAWESPDGVVCARVRVGSRAGFLIPPGDAARPVQTDMNRLDSCYWFVRYGLAGENVSEWFGLIGYQMGEWADSYSAEFEPRFLGPIETFGLFSPAQPKRPETGIHGWACIAGEVELCDANFREPGVVTSTDRAISELVPGYVRNRNQGYRLVGGSLDYSVLSDLEMEFGTEAFHAFWTSDKSVPTAFEEAFGVAPANWMHDRIVGKAGVLIGGPILDRTTILFVMLTMAFGAWVGSLLARARESV